VCVYFHNNERMCVCVGDRMYDSIKYLPKFKEEFAKATEGYPIDLRVRSTSSQLCVCVCFLFVFRLCLSSDDMLFCLRI